MEDEEILPPSSVCGTVEASPVDYNVNVESSHRRSSSTIVALVNSKSGERSSANYILRELRTLFGPDQVHDFFATGAFNFQAAQEFIKMQAPHTVLVAGGDGTVSLAMDVCEAAAADRGTTALPHICVLPMGTGNDLSRTVGSGGGFSKPNAVTACCESQALENTVTRITHAPSSNIDRWLARAYDGRECSPTSELIRPVTFVNYFSIGFDAHIATKFANFRELHPALCRYRNLNKLWYTCFNFQAFCGERTLDSVEILVDGKIIPTPKGLKSIALTNVTHFASGVQLWRDSKKAFKQPQIDDGELEIQGIFGPFHMIMLQAGLRKALKIGQGKHVVLRAPKIWCQFDGEALEGVKQRATGDVVTIEISHRSKFPILSCTVQPVLSDPGCVHTSTT